LAQDSCSAHALGKAISVKVEFSPKEMTASSTLQMQGCEFLQSIKESLKTIKGNAICNHEAFLEQIDTLVQVAWKVEGQAEASDDKRRA